jgi:hypothetical protein
VLAVDAAGALAGRAFEGHEVRPLAAEAADGAEGGVLVGSGPAALCEALAKASRESAREGAEALRAALADAAPTSARVWLDPQTRTLGVDDPDGGAFQFSLAGSA